MLFLIGWLHCCPITRSTSVIRDIETEIGHAEVVAPPRGDYESKIAIVITYTSLVFDQDF